MTRRYGGLFALAAVVFLADCTCSDRVGSERWQFGAPAPDGFAADTGIFVDTAADSSSVPDVGCRRSDTGTCNPCLARPGGAAGWERHSGRGVICFDHSHDRHGEPKLYRHASIPPTRAAGWNPVGRSIHFAGRSAVCDAHHCECLDGADFTYYQTFFRVPSGFRVDSLRIHIRDVDDGARVTVFNSAHPAGVTPHGSYAYLNGGTTTDIGDELEEGLNRIVVTHVDDCCKRRRIQDVDVRLNDSTLDWCRP